MPFFVENPQNTLSLHPNSTQSHTQAKAKAQMIDDSCRTLVMDHYLVVLLSHDLGRTPDVLRVEHIDHDPDTQSSEKQLPIHVSSAISNP